MVRVIDKCKGSINMKIRIKKISLIILTIAVLMSNIKTVAFAEGESEGVTSAVEENVVFTYPEAPEITAGAGIIMDADTGAILYEKDIHGIYYPASITKIMTCLLAIENLSLDQQITYTDEVFETLPWDAALLGVQRGEILTVKDCLYGLMLRSGNEVAVALAITISGSEEEFGKLMTERAKEMGALNTVFTNASGLYQDTHYTTAYDMAVITREALKNGTFCEVWGTETYDMSATNLNEAYTISNRHSMLLSNSADYYEYAEGGKTGYEDLAKRTLVTHAKKDGLSLICVVLFDEPSQAYINTEALLDYGFTNFKKVRVIDEEDRFGGSDGFVSIPDTDYITIPKNMNVSDLEYELIYNEDNSDGNIAQLKYYSSEHFLGQSTITFTIADVEDDGVVKPVKKAESKEEKLYIDIQLIIMVVILVIVLILVIIYLVKTKKERKIKRDRKRLFKEASRKYKVKKRRRL